MALLECTICLETMHAPVLCECGHLFCYECIMAWFSTKLLCPTCRSDIDTKPRLNLSLRDMAKLVTEMMVDCTLDLDEKRRLRRVAQDRARAYDDDFRDNALFGELFDLATTMIDNLDGVPRCGLCGWEVHGLECDHCGAHLRRPVDEFDEDERAAYEQDSLDNSDIEIRLNGRDSYDSDDGFVVNSDEEVINVGEAVLSDADLWHGLLERELDHDGSDDERGSHDLEPIAIDLDLEHALSERLFLSDSERPYALLEHLLSDDEEMNEALDNFRRPRNHRVIEVSDDDDE